MSATRVMDLRGNAMKFLGGLLIAAELLALGACISETSHTGAKSGQRGIILLRYAPGSESTEQRERGFLETLAKNYPKLTILSSNQYAGATANDALAVAERLVNRFGPQADGIFAVNESSSMGMLGALREAGLEGKVTYIGFDTSPRLIQALEAGQMQGLVVQNPVEMGYRSVLTMVAHLEGKQVEKRIPTGEYLATPENLRDEKTIRMLSPPQFTESTVRRKQAPKYILAMIPKGTTHEFWKSVHYGADKAARELGNVELLWKGPLKEDDRDAQISVMQNFITKKVSGILLAPLDSRGLAPAVKEARAAGIPTVIFDSALDDPTLAVSYVATDNYHGGQLAAQRLGEVLTSRQTK